MPQEWWERFFSGLWLDVQRELRADRTPAEADFIEQVLRLRPGAAVLDVPCGEGRLTLELAARGYQMTGVDITEAVLAEARQKAAGRGLQIAWHRRDMRDLPWKEAFAGAFCVWTSFGYFDDAGNEAFLRAVSAALRPGARFLLEFQALAETLLPRFQERSWGPVGDVLVLEERRYDHARSRVDVEWTFVRGGRIEKKSSSIRVYTYRELCELLARVGFAEFEAYGSLEGEPFRLGQRLYLVAAKTAG
ncbi:MAG: class I SAM-dependent methyltransferase [Armatimonadetes bacterium]|nr:class I SAM-dependent methyltransferase [Armatimonadota bacterium]